MPDAEYLLSVPVLRRNGHAAVRSFYVVIALVGGLTAWFTAISGVIPFALILIAALEFYAGIYADDKLRPVIPRPTSDWILTTHPDQEDAGSRSELAATWSRETRTERRKSPRRPVYGHGIIVSPSSNRTGCVVENMSTDGAKLEIANNDTLPDAFFLATQTQGLGFWVRVIWRSGSTMGVQITQQAVMQLPIASGRHLELVEQAA